MWINFDDDMTDIIKQEQKYIDDAYLLFFKKVDMPTSSLVIYSDLSAPSWFWCTDISIDDSELIGLNWFKLSVVVFEFD